MAQYKVLETSYIHDKLVNPGDIVEWDVKKHGTAGPNLEPLKKAKASAIVEDDSVGDETNEGIEA